MNMKYNLLKLVYGKYKFNLYYTTSMGNMGI